MYNIYIYMYNIYIYIYVYKSIKEKATVPKTTGWCPLLWHFYQEITSDLRVKK